MIEREPTFAECKRKLYRGMKVTLPDGEPGIFIKMRKTQCEVMRGAEGEGMLACVPLEGLIKITFGVIRRTKR